MNDCTQAWKEIWEKTKSYDNFDASQIDAFFSRLVPQAMSEGFLMLTAPTEFIKRWIESHYSEVISKALQDTYGMKFTIAIEVDPTQEESSSDAGAGTSSSTISNTPTPAPIPQNQSIIPGDTQNLGIAPTPNTTQNVFTPVLPQVPASQMIHSHPAIPTNMVNPVSPEMNVSPDGSGLRFASGYSFEGFVVGSSNRMAYSMAVAVAESPGQPHLNPLFLYGKSGLGKTHLMRSIQNYVNKTYPQLKTVYVDTMELVNDYTDAAISKNSQSYNTFRMRYESADVLLVDDVQGLQNKEGTLNMVFQILNKMVDRGKQVVLSADRAPKNIDIEERYKSRFNSGGTCDIQPPEMETKLGIIKNYIEECRSVGGAPFDFPQEIQVYIAQNSSSNIRELKSAVTKIIFELRNNNAHLSVQDVSRLLADHFTGGHMKKVTVADVQKVVEEYFNVTHAELIGKKRAANITYARQIAIYLCRTMIDIPHNTIGGEFNRDHSTIMYSVKSVEERLKDSQQLNEELEIIRQKIVER